MDELGAFTGTTRPKIRYQEDLSINCFSWTAQCVVLPATSPPLTVVHLESFGYPSSGDVGSHSLDWWPVRTCLANPHENASCRCDGPRRPRPLVRTSHAGPA